MNKERNICIVGLGLLGKAVVDGVGGGQAAVLKAQAAEVDCGLHHVLQRGGDLVPLHRGQGIPPLLHQQVVAETGHHQPGVGHVAPGHGAGAAVLAGPGLKPGGQRVAQAGGKEPPGGVGDDAGIDQNQIRVAAHEHGLDNHPGVVVEHGHAGAGRVVGGTVGIMTQGRPRFSATALAVSMVLPPPMPTTTSGFRALARPVQRRISSSVHWPPNCSHWIWLSLPAYRASKRFL